MKRAVVVVRVGAGRSEGCSVKKKEVTIWEIVNCFK